LYNKGILRSTGFNLPIICVGNLSVGGTGKSPMVEWLVKFLHRDLKVAVLSRGYKRRTKGYALAGENTTALDIGDEPMQFHNKFPDVSIAVGEERIVAIPQLLHDRPDTKVIILDDAFQHRSIKAGLNIVLTSCDNLFTRDWVLPSGDLRDERKSYKRADVIVVTKCSPMLSIEEKEALKQEIKPLPHQQVFFTTIHYGLPYHILTKKEMSLNIATEVLLVSGIANPLPLKKYLQDAASTYYEILYSDHHIFSIDDWKEMAKRFNNIPAEDKIILTTEKDAVRLVKFGQTLQDYPVYVIPIEIQFLFNEGHQFTDIISKFITEFSITN
jgi:tetraacyldisaccharide 4'-kinase